MSRIKSDTVIGFIHFFHLAGRVAIKPRNYTNSTQGIVNGNLLLSCKFKCCSALSNEKKDYTFLAEADETRSHLDLSHFAHCIMGFIQLG